MAIEERNIIVKFSNNLPEFNEKLRESDRLVGGLKDAASKVGKELTDAFKTELAEKLFQVIEKGGVSIDKLGGNVDDIKKGIDDAFDTLTPEQFAKAVTNVNELLDDTKQVEFEISKSSEEAFDGDKPKKMGKEVKKLNKDLVATSKYTDVLAEPIAPEAFAAAIEQQRKAAREAREETKALREEAQKAVPTFQKWQEENKKTESIFTRLGRQASNVFGNIRAGVSNVSGSLVSGFNKGLDTIAGGVQKLFGFIGRLGGLAAILGIADLIAGWSTFSKQVQATVSKFPGVQSTFAKITDAVRRLGELFGRTIAPVIKEIGEGFNGWLRNLDLGLLQKLFRAFGIVLSNFAKQVGQLFGSGDGSATSVIIGFATTVTAVINGVIQSFDEFLGATKAFFLDFANLVLRGLKAIAPFNSNVAALQAAVEVLAEGARKDMKSISGAFKAGFDEIKNLNVEDIKFEDIIPTPTPEETKKAEEELKRQQEILQEWLETLNGVAGEIMGFRTPSEELVDRIGDLRKEIERLNAEANRLKDEGIISETQFKSAQLLIEQYRVQGIEKLRESLKKFQLDKLSLLESADIKELVKDLNEMGIAQQGFAKSLEVREIVERQVQRATAERLRQQDEEQKKIEKLVTTLGLVSEGFRLFGEAAITALNIQRQSIQEQIANLDRLANAQEDRVQRAILLAEKGNTELLQQEETRLQLINEAREQAARREREIAAIQVATAQAVALAQGIAAVIQGFVQGGLITGIANSLALAGTIASTIIAVKNAFNDLPAFWTGEDFIDGPAGIDKILARVSRGERVMTVRQNREIGGKAVSNEELVRRASLGKQLQDTFKISALGELSTPRVMDAGAVSDLAKGLISIQRSQEQRLDRLATEVIGVKRELQHLAVSFNITPEGIEAAVSSVQERRKFRNNLRR